MGYRIEYGIVPLVSDAGYDRQRKLCTGSSQQISIKAGQIGSGTSTTDDNHHIELVHPGIHCIEGSQYRLLHLVALHQGGKKFRTEVEPARVVLQLMAEIAITGCRSRRDDRNALWQ